MIDHLAKVVIKELNSKVFVETGLFMGETIAEVSLWFSELYPHFGKVEKLQYVDDIYGGPNPWNSRVPFPAFINSDVSLCEAKIYSIELDSTYCEKAKERFSSNPNITFINDSSEIGIKSLIDGNYLGAEKNPFIFLDAHWNDDYWPLYDEFKALIGLKKVIILVDDFQVPGHPEFSNCVYGGKRCSISLIKGLIQGDDIHVYFPHYPSRDFCGWVIIFKGYNESELSFLQDLPLFAISETKLHRRLINSFRSWLKFLLIDFYLYLPDDLKNKTIRRVSKGWMDRLKKLLSINKRI
jgi:hypothetical protein